MKLRSGYRRVYPTETADRLMVRRPLISRLLWLLWLGLAGWVAVLPVTEMGGVKAAGWQQAAVVSAASYGGSGIAAEEIVALFGSGLADGVTVAGTGELPTTLGGVTVKVRDGGGSWREARLFFVSPGQINFEVPAGLVTGAGEAEVWKRGVLTARVGLRIEESDPGLFAADASGKGLAAAGSLRLKADRTQIYEATVRYDAARRSHVAIPIDPEGEGEQVYLIMYGTGLRRAGSEGRVRVTIGGVAAEVIYAGAQGGYAGLDQINVRLPRGLSSGEWEVLASVDGKVSNGVRVRVGGSLSSETIYLATLRPGVGVVSPGAGYGMVRLNADDGEAVVRVSYANLTSPETSVHVGGVLGAGQRESILLDLGMAPRQIDGTWFWDLRGSGGVTTGREVIEALRGGRVCLSVNSERYPTGELRGCFGGTAGGQDFVPPASPPQMPSTTTTARDAARLLTQATFGPRAVDIAAVQQKGASRWIEEQLAMPVPAESHAVYIDKVATTRTNIYQSEMMESFWNQAITAPDQLRQRVVYALSQIMVVSFRSNIENEPWAMAGYIDMLGRNAFGNFRQLLEGVTLSPAMGRYLDHLANDKEDPATGRNPNENYARELLQLFSIGLYKLHPDGSLMLDASGAPIATYGQNEVKGFAHVFTGWSYGWLPATEDMWYWPDIWQNGTKFWRVPMQSWASHHSSLQKQILNGVILPAGQKPEKDLKDALDNVFNHPNVGPFIARLLIQRLVTSNPSTGYVYRVAQKFNDNGSGVRGDMKAVIRAILLDYEARSLDNLTNQGYGKLREPVLRLSHLLRAFNFKCPCGYYPIYWMDSPEWAIGQNPFRSPSVFNFYQPHYRYPGVISAAGLDSPEFQITNETSVIGISNFMKYVAEEGFGWEESKPVVPDYSALQPLAGTPSKLIDQLDLLLTSGAMPSTLKTKLIEQVGRISASTPLDRVSLAIAMIITSPDYVVQK